MAENQEINEFARKWNQAFRAPETRERDVELGLPEDCRRLGFKMDCGEAFRKQYGDAAFSRPEALEKIADQIREEQVLGAAIYSKWRFITHWSQDSLLTEENRRWFQIAFYRLLLLTSGGWKKSWVRQAGQENPVLQKVMMKTLEDYLKQHPEG